MKIRCYDAWMLRWLKTFANTITTCIALALGLVAVVTAVLVIATSVGAAFTFHWMLGILALIVWLGIIDATIEVWE